MLKSRVHPLAHAQLLASRGQALTLNPASLFSLQHGASGAKPTLVVFAVETGGRWGPEPTAFLQLLAQARAASTHAAVRSALRAAYVSRWSGIIAVAAQRALASSLPELPLEAVAAAASEPAVHEVLQDARWLDTPALSRLPART
ncbi:NSF [Symbiodinium sp. KB8]|nr:NSF [Symbiodinium sp. KB8]